MNSEGSHWYLPDGVPFHEVKARDGHLRAVTIRDARKVHAVPSVTTVLRVIERPALTRWMMRQRILAALTLPREPIWTERDYLDRIDNDARQQAQDAAAEGSRIHEALHLERLGKPYDQQYAATLCAVRAEVERLFPGVKDWVPEARFANADGFGGMCDLHSPSTGHIIDYKGKEGDFSDGARLAWDQHWQLGGYGIGLQLPLVPCANVFFSRTHPGSVSSHVWTETDMQAGRRVFTAALALWKAVHAYP